MADIDGLVGGDRLAVLDHDLALEQSVSGWQHYGLLQSEPALKALGYEWHLSEVQVLLDRGGSHHVVELRGHGHRVANLVRPHLDRLWIRRLIVRHRQEGFVLQHHHYGLDSDPNWLDVVPDRNGRSTSNILGEVGLEGVLSHCPTALG